jgi:hypothetical protein
MDDDEGKATPTDFMCIARNQSGELEQFCVKNVRSVHEANVELRFQVRDLSTVLWLVKT